MKRVLSLFLSCIFVLGVCFSTPIVASATETNTNEFTTVSGVFQYVEDSQECSVKEWRGSGGDLTLTDVQYNEITYTITGILSGAFSGCTDLKTLTIKSNITKIEDGAFSGCSGLLGFKVAEGHSKFDVDALEIPVEEGEEAVTDCGVLIEKVTDENEVTTKKIIAYPVANPTTEYTIPADVTEIADGAFANCTSINAFSVSVDTYFSTTEDGILFNANKTKLIAYPAGKTDVTTYTIPATVTEIADGAFSGCKSLETITVAEGNTAFSATDDGVLFNKEETNLVAYPAGKIAETYTIPTTVTEIADGAFSGANVYLFSENSDGSSILGSENLKIHYEYNSEKGYKHNYVDAVCTVCELVCEHTWENGACTECGLVCEHTGVTCGEEGPCTTCGATYTASHEWTFANQDGENVITATCENVNCIYAEENAVTITLASPTDGLVYDGKEKTANVTVSAENTGIQIPEIEYSGDRVNVTKAGYTATITLGDGENVVTATMNLNITSKSLTDNDVTITGLESSYVYTGSEIEPTVVVKDGNDILVKDRDYTVEYSNNTEVSTEGNPAIVTITFKGNYSGEVTKTFEIVAHKHDWTFAIIKDENENKISATCTDSNCTYYETGEIFSLIINSNEHLVYDNNVKNNPVNIDYSANAQDAFGEEFLNNLSVSYSYNGESCTVKNAGIYTATLVMGEGENSATITKTFEITPKTLTAELSSASGTYDGNAHTPDVIFKDNGSYEVSLTDEGENPDYKVECSDNVNAGIVTLKVELLNSNYTFVNEGFNTPKKELTYTINKAQLSESDFTFTKPDSWSYGEETGISVTPNNGINVSTENIAVKYYAVVGENEVGDASTVAPTDVGTYKVKIDVKNSGNYEDIIDLTDDSWTFTIDEATATFTAPIGKENLEYIGSAQELITAGTATGGTIYYTLTPDNENSWSTKIPTGTDAGDYTVYYKFIVGDNYAYTGENATTGTCKVTIAPHGHSWTYLGDGSTNTITAKCINCPLGNTYVTLTLIMPIPEVLVYNNEAKSVSVYVSDENANVIVPQPIYTYNGEEIGECKNAGDYKATITIGEAKASIDFTITKATLKATDIPLVMPKNPVYNGGSQTVSIDNSGKISADNINVKYYKVLENGETESLDSAPINAGTYKVKVDVTGEDNYEDVIDLTCDEWQFTIAKKELSTITIGGIDAKTYTGSPLTPSVNVAITDAEGGHPVTLAPEEYEVTYDKNINAGEAIVKITLTGNYTYNGNSEDLTKTFIINKATPDVEKFAFTAPENLTYDGNEKTATVVVKDGITGMGAITIKYYDSEGKEVTPKAEGTYTVKIDIAEGTNFVAATEFTSGDWKFTIKAHEHDWKYTASGAVITATCQNNGCDIETTTVELVAPENLVYDGTEKSVTVKAPHADLLSEYTVTNMKATDAGKYTAFIKIGNATASLDFEISKAVIVVTKVTAIDRVYDGNLVVSINKTDGIVYTGLIDGDKVGFDLSALTGTLSDANVGSNKTVKVNGSIVLTGEDAKNYDVSTPGVTNVNITPATVTITPDAKTSEQYYGLPALTYKVTGLIGADTLTKAPTLTTNADIKKTGDYTITAAGAEASANYVIKYATAPLTITAHKNHIVKDGTWKETVHGTCMVAGKEAGTCTLCGGTITRDSKTDPNNHTLITTVTKFQTCTQNGEALVTCANGCKYSLKTAVPADGKSHNFAKDFTVIESTCVAKGSKFKVCENEGCKVVTEKTEIAINPAAHKNIVTINAKDATCEEKGYTGDKFCNDCKKTIDPGIEINAKGHTESDWIVDKEATFTEEGAKHTACTVCKKELKKEVIAKRALETPEVKIENVSNGIKVSWSQDEDAAGYTVYSSIYNASTKKWSAWKNRGTAAANRSSWTDKTVTEGVTYRYTVRAVNGSNRSAYKATAGLLYVSAPKVTVTISSTGLLAKWNKVNNATGYIVYRRALVNGVWSSWVNLGTTAPEKNSWFDSNVQSGVSYRYTVRAVVNKVRGGYIASSAVIYLAQPLLNISNAKAGVAGKWEPIAGATGYTIYRSEYNPSTKKWTKWLTLGTTGATAKTFTDKTVKSGYKYKYTIRAVNGKFRSTYQDSNKLVYLAQPTLKISNVANGIQGSWNQVNGATGYIIYRRELKDGKWSNWTSLGTTKATAKTFTDKTVKSGVTYRYTVRATNGVVRSSYASTGSLVFLSVPKVKISSGITGVNVSWSKIDGATSYLVYRREIANGKWTGWSRITTVTETSFVDETAKSGIYYRYTVRALNGKSSSKYTSTSTLYYLATPIVTVAKIDDGIKVNWTQVTGVTGYTIYRAQLGADGKWSKWVTLGTATDKYSSCKDKTAKTGVTYKYTVRAVNGKVRSAYIDGAQIVNTVQ